MPRGTHSPRFMVSPGKQRSSGALRRVPGQVPVNAVAVAGVNMEHAQRAARGRTTLMPRNARRSLGWAGQAPGR
jgi:hypothetical protein